MRKSHINCDSCGPDLTDAGPRPDYYLTLQAVRMATTSQVQYAVHVTPPLNEAKDFCSKQCLNNWLNPST